MSRQLNYPPERYNVTTDPPFIEVEDDETFHIGQCYENHAAVTIECAQCKSRVFNVGVGHCFTGIRCVNCEWEICVHQG